jgi:hypothetical protein
MFAAPIESSLNDTMEFGEAGFFEHVQGGRSYWNAYTSLDWRFLENDGFFQPARKGHLLSNVEY